MTEQPSYLDAHYRLLETNSNAVFWNSKEYKRYAVQIVCDEQPISQSTGLIDHDGHQILIGLDTILTMGSVIEFGGIEKILELISEGDLKYISAILEFRVVDVTGIHCSNPMTAQLAGKSKGEDFLSYVKRSVELVQACISCRQVGLDNCKFAEGSHSCINCKSKGLFCESFNVQGFVCDMAEDHIAVEEKVDAIVPLVYGIYHIVKAITNYARNNTLILNGCYFSIQVLLSLYTYSYSHGTDIGVLPRTVFVSTDRQSDVNSYLMCSKEVRKTLRYHNYITFQRYPDVYEGPKSFFQIPLQPIISQTFVNKNGEIFIVECGYKVSVISHKVLCQKQSIKTVGGLDFGEPSSLHFGIVIQTKRKKTRSTGAVVASEHEHLFVMNYQSKTLWIMSHLQKTMTYPTYVSTPLKCLFQHKINLKDQTASILYCSPSSKGILVAVNVLLLTVSISYIPIDELFQPASKGKDTDDINDIELTSKCLMLLAQGEQFHEAKIHNEADSILCLSTAKVTLFNFSSGLLMKEIVFSSECASRSVYPYEGNEFVIVNNINMKVDIHCTTDNTVKNMEILGISKIYCATSYKKSIIVVGEDVSNENTPSIHILTALSEAETFCSAVEMLYNCVGFSNSSKVLKPTNCLKTSFDQRSKLANNAFTLLSGFKDARTKIFNGALLSSGSIGFISDSTYKCLKKTVDYINKLECHFSSANNWKLARVDCLINELYCEGYFGNITSQTNGGSADLRDYLYSKRKVEINSIIKNCSKSFVYHQNKNKLYAELLTSDIKAWDALQILKQDTSPRFPISSQEPKATLASRKFMQQLYQHTKGQRCRAARSNHKKIAMTEPYQIFDAKHKAKRKKESR